MKMKMKNIQLALPWNISRYMGNNGFHPLYRPLFEGDFSERCFVVDEVRLANKLENDISFWKRIESEISKTSTKIKSDHSNLPIEKMFYEHLGAAESWFVNEMPGDVEFHHTSPLTLGKRPFVFHCESFLPIFMPFAFQGQGFKENVSQMKDFYGNLLASENCLSIQSHIGETLTHISDFFDDVTIKSKLRKSQVGLNESALTFLSSLQKADSDVPRFLFSGSAHQNPRSFPLRGGTIALLFAQRHLQSGEKGQFIFRCPRPCREDLCAWGGLDADFLEREDGHSIIWIEGFLGELEQLRLFSSVDFYLLPSLNLHSVSIMQAMAAGAIPIVTDTIGTSTYIDDGETGVILKGVRDKIWEMHSSNIPVDLHQNFDEELKNKLLYQLEERIQFLLENPRLMKDMRSRAILRVKEGFTGRDFAQSFWKSVDEVTENINLFNNQLSIDSPLLEVKLFDKTRFIKLFESPPHPTCKIINSELTSIFNLKGNYYVTRNQFFTRPSGLDDWFPLGLKSIGALGDHAVKVTETLSDAQKYIKLMDEKMHWGAILLNKFQIKLKNYLISYPWIFGKAKLFRYLAFGLVKRVRAMFF